MTTFDFDKFDPVMIRILNKVLSDDISGAQDMMAPIDKRESIFGLKYKRTTKRNNSKKPWKLNDAHTDRITEQQKTKKNQIEYYKKNRVIDEALVARRKKIRELKEFLDKGE